MAVPVALSRRISSRRARHRASARSGGDTRGARVLVQGRRILLAANPGAMDIAAIPLRPVDASRVERGGTPWPSQCVDYRLCGGSGKLSGALMPVSVFIFLAVLSIISSLGV